MICTTQGGIFVIRRYTQVSSCAHSRTSTMQSIRLVIYFLIYCELPEGILSVKKEDYAEAFKPVMIGGRSTTYSMVELPGSETQVVVDERRKLLGDIHLRTFVQDLGHVKRYIQLANDRMAAASSDPECGELQLEVQRLGYNVTRLCANSADTVSNCNRNSITILTDLQPMYEYLLDGFEDLALETLASVSDIAAQCAKAAEELNNSFDEIINIVERILQKMQKMKAEKEHTMKQREADFTTQEMKCQYEYQQFIKALNDKNKAEESYFGSKLKQEKAIENFSDKKAGGLLQGVYKVIGIASIEQTQESKDKQYKYLNEIKMEDLKMTLDKEEKVDQVLQSLGKSIIELQRYSREVLMANSSANALHQAIEGLKPLRGTMIQAKHFWKRMKEHCKALSDSKLRDTVAKEMREHSDEQQLKFWISMPFKKQVVRLIAGWVALDDVCGEYVGYEYKKNPTPEDSEENDAHKTCTDWDSNC